MQEKEIMELTEEEKDLVLLFRSLSDDKKEKFIYLMDSIKALIME